MTSIQNSNPNTESFIVKNAPSQASDSFQVVADDDTVLFSVDPSGAVIAAGNALASLSYVSTTVSNAIADLVDSAPDTLNTLGEIATALNDDANLAATLTTEIGLKCAKASNLSDLASASTSRTNLGLGSFSTVNVPSGSGFVKTSSGSITTIDTNTYLTSSTGVSSITGTANQVVASGSTGAITLSLPQSIGTSSVVTFGSVGCGSPGVNFGSLAAGALAVTKSSLGLFPTDALVAVNATAAAAGAQQVSPSITWRGNGWKTASTAASQTVDFRCYVLTTQGTTNPTGAWRLQSNVNGGGYSDRISVDSGGLVTVQQFQSVGTAIFSADVKIGSIIDNSNQAVMNCPTGGRTLMDSGSNQAIDFDNRLLTLSTGETILNWNGTSQLNDSSGNPSLDATIRNLFSDNGNCAVDYQNRNLADESGSGVFFWGGGTLIVSLGMLPTSDPSNGGQLWNSSGTLKISAG